MQKFRYWRKMTWVIAAFSAIMAFWTVSGGSLAVVALWLGALVPLTVLWFMTRPLWRVGHGARLRRLTSVEIPFRSLEGFNRSRGYSSRTS